MLSLKRYGWLCVLGAEAFYVLCIIYDVFLSGAPAELHRSLFGLLAGFTWLTVGSFILGAVYMFVFAWIFAAYVVWMHNSSLINK